MASPSMGKGGGDLPTSRARQLLRLVNQAKVGMAVTFMGHLNQGGDRFGWQCLVSCESIDPDTNRDSNG
jgi:hypothetical protein